MTLTPTQTASDEGWDARLRDQPIETCPHTDLTKRAFWREGWWLAEENLQLMGEAA